MSVKWTKEQEQVIRLQNRNILVSAAAGSGKTAVLVERILQMMMRKEHPVDIDKLLVVTFTRAAAGEMKERLSAAVEKKLEEEPGNEHLQRQQTLIHNAQINTIDGFCSYVIRNYFHTIDLDPGFRVANEGELKLLKMDVAKDLLEENYAGADEEFQRFVEVFASGKTDDGLIELILKLYEFSMSNPWPKEWLESCMEPYLAKDAEEIEKSPWIKKMWEDVSRELQPALACQENSENLIHSEDGPHMYEEAVALDKKILREFSQSCENRDFDSCARILGTMKFAALSRKKDPDVSEKKREQVKSERDELKSILKNLKERYFYADSAGILKELELCAGPVSELVRLTTAFIDAFGAKKRQKNIVDFSDMEHFALDILVQNKEGKLQYTPVADEFAQRFEEIMIDEYQDSNLVQETILQSISRMRKGRNNIFMVGDVKQSIYRFRLARPELFMEKYENYSHEESECQRIDLHKNFRSRPQVLAGVNYIFEQIMGKELGGVEYDEAAALYPGAQFPPKEPESIGTDDFEDTEVWLVSRDGEELQDDQSEATAQELEARMVGGRIRQIVGHEQVLDKQTGTYRPARYQDCVILLRTISGWAETFVQVLMDMGIPAYATSKTGYFSALEVVTVLNYLRILDNPMQEIPFTGVLRSPVAGCTAKELALIKTEYPDKKIYEGAWLYSREEHKTSSLHTKLREFFSRYEQLRERVPYTPIHELIQMILQITDYDTYAAAMPGGVQRKANLEMLAEKAMEFESTSYRGLFNFIRYIEQLQKYQVDFGEVSISGENEDTVRIMSIHKSKGLEFPIVFVSGMGKRFNMTDANAGLIVHPDLGIGTFGVEPELRIKVPCLMRQVIQKQIRLESLGEELRVLYVALTRAKEKLILTGSIGKIEKRIEALGKFSWYKEVRLPYGTIEGAQDYWGWILPALARHPAMEPFYRAYGGFPDPLNPCWTPQVRINLNVKMAAVLVGEEIKRQIFSQQLYQSYENWDKETVYQEELKSQLDERFSYEYPYSVLQDIPAKLSVSEIKHRNYEENDDEAVKIIPEGKSWTEETEPREPVIPDFMKSGTKETEPEEFETKESEPEEFGRKDVKREESGRIEPIIPDFMKSGEERELKGAARGTAYHRVLECLEYEKTESKEKIIMQLKQLEELGRIDMETLQSVNPGQIHWFVRSPLGRRMKQADRQGKLWREQQFVISIPANRQNPAWDVDEQVLVQGIIDAFFEEEDGYVLVDYKTDYVKPGEEPLLLERYQKQLWYYAEALERVGERKVKQAYIYSFALGKEIAVGRDCS
jgi:ATP-dependent helicase/nuclease subunit A